MSLYFSMVPEGEKAILDRIFQIYREDKAEVFEGLMNKFNYLQKHHENSDVVISGVYGRGKDTEFGIIWFKKENDGLHPQTRDEKPFMVGGLIHHGNGKWGVHT